MFYRTCNWLSRCFFAQNLFPVVFPHFGASPVMMDPYNESFLLKNWQKREPNWVLRTGKYIGFMKGKITASSRLPDFIGLKYFEQVGCREKTSCAQVKLVAHIQGARPHLLQYMANDACMGIQLSYYTGSYKCPALPSTFSGVHSPSPVNG